jgi:hypothetical protein
MGKNQMQNSNSKAKAHLPAGRQVQKLVIVY